MSAGQPANRSTGLMLDLRCNVHDTGPGHPERPDRLIAVDDELRRTGLMDSLTLIEAVAATDEQILAAHSQAYLATIQRDCQAGRRTLSTGDTPLSAGSLEAARLHAGGVCRAVDAVVSGAVRNAFCAGRPPGHHATRSRGMGFCILNNVAIAARHAQNAHGLRRVLILDWDVHHGNGTQDIFYRDGDVMLISTHQEDIYPGTGPAEQTGEADGAGTTINRPLPPGTTGREILELYERELLPAGEAFEPDIVLISAGFDARCDDLLGRLEMEDEDFATLTRRVMDLANRCCGGRVVSVLEGGYGLAGLRAAVVRHVTALRDPGA